MRSGRRGAPGTGGAKALAAGVAVFLVVGAAWLWSREAAPREHEVVIRGFVYEPAAVSVGPGERVVWVNEDFVAHTVTAQDGTWDSGEIPPGGRWTLTVGAEGSAYLCTLHPTMVGEVVLP